MSFPSYFPKDNLIRVMLRGRTVLGLVLQGCCLDRRGFPHQRMGDRHHECPLVKSEVEGWRSGSLRTPHTKKFPYMDILGDTSADLSPANPSARNEATGKDEFAGLPRYRLTGIQSRTYNCSATDRTYISLWQANREENIPRYARWLQCSTPLSLAHLTAIMPGSREIISHPSVFSRASNHFPSIRCVNDYMLIHLTMHTIPLLQMARSQATSSAPFSWDVLRKMPKW